MTMILLAVPAGLQTPGAAPKSAQACTSAALVGTWQVASAKLGDEVSPTGRPNCGLKHWRPNDDDSARRPRRSADAWRCTEISTGLHVRRFGWDLAGRLRETRGRSQSHGAAELRPETLEAK